MARSDTKLATFVQSWLYLQKVWHGDKCKKMKVMTNRENVFQNKLTFGGSNLESVSYFKYLGAIFCEAGSKPEILVRTAQASAAMSHLKLVWKDRRISIRTKVKLVQTMIKSIFLYACENGHKQLNSSRESKQLRCIGCRPYLTYHTQTMCPTTRSENVLRERVTTKIFCQESKDTSWGGMAI